MAIDLRAPVFPLYGLLYFVTRPQLWMVVITPLLCALVTVVVITTLLLIFAFPPQALLLSSLFTPWVAPVAAMLLVFAESAVAVQLVISCCLSRAQDAVFDFVYSETSPNAEINLGVAADGVLPDGRSVQMLICFTLLRTFVMIVCLPLNLIPAVGTVLYLCVTGYFLAWDNHSGYFKTKSLSFSEQQQYVAQNWGSYTGFGFVAQLLEFVPGLNVIAYFSNFAGAALWANAMDREQLTPRRGALHRQDALARTSLQRLDADVPLLVT